jgi:hypothetical protein
MNYASIYVLTYCSSTVLVQSSDWLKRHQLEAQPIQIVLQVAMFIYSLTLRQLMMSDHGFMLIVKVWEEGIVLRSRRG